MNIKIPFRYDEDRTGVNPDNLVVGEEHALSTRKIRCISPMYGAFFSESLIVQDAATNAPLVKGSDYEAIEFADMPSLYTGKEIFTVIVIYNTGVTKVKLQYQALGGPASHSMDAVIRMLEALDLGNRPVYWPDIIGKPDKYPPAPHFHDVGDVYGFEYITQAIYELRNAILLGDTASHDEIYAYIDRWGDTIGSDIAALAARLTAHEQDKNNPHGVTKTQIGLSLVQNYGIATQSQAEDGSVNSVYMTPLRTAQAITIKALNPLNKHLADMNNPHNTTKEQVGLKLVDNFATATKEQAETGVANNLFVTPAGVRSAITIQVGDSLQSHITNLNNPHKTTKDHVGLGLVLNYGIANTAQAQQGIATDLYMTPALVLASINKNALTNTDWTSTVITTSKFLTGKYAAGGGFSFTHDNGYDTGMFSDTDGTVDFRTNGAISLRLAPDALYPQKRFILPTMNCAMIQSDWNSPGSMSISSAATVTSDWQVAGFSFNTGSYQIRIGLRNDGIFGVGGASRGAWSWYTDASGNSISAGDVVAYSDPSLKKDFEKISDPFSILDAVSGYTFTWREGFAHTAVKAGRRDYGVNADEIAGVAPEMVAESAEIDGLKFKVVAYEKLIPVLIEGTKLLKSKVDELEDLKEQMTEMTELFNEFRSQYSKHGERAVARILQASGSRRPPRSVSK